jgi:hypothetical protein
MAGSTYKTNLEEQTAGAQLTISASRKPAPFVAGERRRQSTYFSAEFPDKAGFEGAGHRLAPEDRFFNLAPSIREVARSYFENSGISWHTHASHGLSSQACCLNFLMPLANRPDVLSRLVGRALGIPDPHMLPVEPGPDGRPWFVGFEWIGGDYLNEAGGNGARTRGANCTSADAVLRFWHGGITETLLIEWKYTESYGRPIPAEGNETRVRRYGTLAFDPEGPIRNDLGLGVEDFFWEPFYQLLRQQMLAFQMQKAREHGADRVRVLHVSPAANTALKRVTSPTIKALDLGGDAFEVFRNLLVHPDDFLFRSTEELFRPFLTELGDADPWASYLARRYAFVADAPHA